MAMGWSRNQLYGPEIERRAKVLCYAKKDVFREKLVSVKVFYNRLPTIVGPVSPFEGLLDDILECFWMMNESLLK